MLRRDRRELDDLRGGREPVRDVLQRGAEPDRALLHRLGDQLPHALELGGRRRPIVLADHVVPDAARADEGGNVDRGTRPQLETPEVVAEGPPVLHDAEVLRGRGVLAGHPIVDRRDGRALAGHFRRDALEHLARRPAVDQHVEFRLSEQIDEAGRDDQIRGINRCRGGGALQRSDRGDAVAGDADVAAVPGRAGAVDDPAMGDQHVESRSRGLRADRRPARQAGS
jgi:hypothetical protein